MKNLALHKLSNLISILSIRQVGNTTLMKKGTSAYDRPFGIIVHSVEYGKEIADGNLNAHIATMSNLDSLKEKKLPTVIDHYALSKLIGEVYLEIEALSKENNSLKKTIRTMTETFEQYQEYSLKMESLLLDYIESPWWKIKSRKKFLDEYVELGRQKLLILESMRDRIINSLEDEVHDNR